MQLFLFALLIVFITNCKTGNQSSTVSDSEESSASTDEIPSEILKGLTGSVTALDSQSFVDYQIGEVSTSMSFPEAYIALPKLNKFLPDNANITLNGTVVSAADRTGIVAQYAGSEWKTFDGHSLPRYRIGLLNYPDASLEIDITGSTGAPIIWNKSSTVLAAGNVVNPFIGLQIIKLDPSAMNWSPDMRDFKSKILNLMFEILDDVGNRAVNTSVSPVRQGATYSQPPAFILAISNRDLSKAKIRVSAVFGDDVGKIVKKQSVFASLDELLKAR